MDNRPNPRRRREWSDEDVVKIVAEYNKRPAKDLAAEFGVTVCALRNYAQKCRRVGKFLPPEKKFSGTVATQTTAHGIQTVAQHPWGRVITHCMSGNWVPEKH